MGDSQIQLFPAPPDSDTELTLFPSDSPSVGSDQLLAAVVRRRLTPVFVENLWISYRGLLGMAVPSAACRFLVHLAFFVLLALPLLQAI